MTATDTSNVVLEVAIGNCHAGDADRVDEVNAVIHGVKIVGLRSRNKARTLGLDIRDYGDAVNQTYDYEMKALEDAIPLYEAASIYSGHQPYDFEGGVRRIKGGERSNGDLLGWPERVKAVKTGNPEVDGLYADWHYVKSHPMASQVVEIARRRPEKLALSHEAVWADPKVKNGRVVIGRIEAVEAIALVNAKPGTTRGLFENAPEQEPQPMPQKLREVIESLAADHAARPVLLELMGDGYTDAVVEAPEADPDAQVEAAFESMILATYRDENLDTSAKITRWRQIMAAKDKLLGTNTAEETETEEETTAAENQPSTGATVAENQPTKPPVQPQQPDRATILVECADMLGSLKIPATGVLLESMANLPTKEKREAFVKEFAGRVQEAGAPTPRSGTPAPKGAKAPPAKSADETYKEPGAMASAFRRRTY